MIIELALVVIDSIIQNLGNTILYKLRQRKGIQTILLCLLIVGSVLPLTNWTPADNAWGFNRPTRDAGAVQVFYGSSTGLRIDKVGNIPGNQLWAQPVPLVGDDRPEADDRFGSSLVAGNFNGDTNQGHEIDDLAVGVPFEDVSGHSNAGAVNILYGTNPNGFTITDKTAECNVNTIWYQSRPSQGGSVIGGPEPNDYFGLSVASGDFDHDGRDDLAIGVPGEDIETVSNAKDHGSVNVLYGEPCNGILPSHGQLWNSGGRMNADGYISGTDIEGNVEKNDKFGYALAVGDFNHDGRDDLAIGEAGEDVEGWTIGANWGGLFSTLIEFGGAVAAAPDGVPPPGAWIDAGIGIYNNIHYDETHHPGAGAVQTLFGKTGEGLTSTGQGISDKSPWHDSSAETGDALGSALARVDYNHDGKDDIAIGVPGEDYDVEEEGAVKILAGPMTYPLCEGAPCTSFYNLDSASLGRTKLRNDAFGYALAAGNFNGDSQGQEELAIGAPFVRANGLDGAGSVYVSSYKPGVGLPDNQKGHVLTQQNTGTGRAEYYDRFGEAIAWGDFNDDGKDDLAIGVPGEDLELGVSSAVANKLCASPSYYDPNDSVVCNAGVVDVVYGSNIWPNNWQPGALRTQALQQYQGDPSDLQYRDMIGKAEDGDLFGKAIATGDFNGDGYDDLAVGIPGDDLAEEPVYHVPYVKEVKIKQDEHTKYSKHWVDSNITSRNLRPTIDYTASIFAHQNELYANYPTTINILFSEKVKKSEGHPVVELKLNPICIPTQQQAEPEDTEPGVAEQMLGGACPESVVGPGPSSVGVEKGSFYYNLDGDYIQANEGSAWSGTFKIPREWVNRSFAINIYAENTKDTVDYPLQLDIYPGNIARASHNYPYSLIGYQPGEFDRNHGAQVGGSHPLIPMTAAPPPTPPPTGSNKSEAVNHPPIANAIGPKEIKEGTKTLLLGNQSTDPDKGDKLSYQWKQVAPVLPKAGLTNPEHPNVGVAFPNVDKDTSFVFELTVTDSRGAHSKDAISIMVRDQPPLID